MKLSTVVSCSILVTTSLAAQSAFDFDKWSHNDLLDYVNDHMSNLKDVASESMDDLKKDASEVWEQNAHPKPWWKFWASDDKQFPWVKSSSSPVSDWLFNSWSKEDLYNFLKKHKIDAQLEDSKDQLVNKVQENFNDISKKLDSSGYYPSSSYFNDWSIDDLKNWLKEYNIPAERSIKDKKDELIKQVRKNIYQVSAKVEKERLNLLDSLDLANKQFLDKTGELKENIFDTWSKDDLEKWLASHKVKLDEKMMDSHDYLVETANNNYDLLKDDINWYLKTLKKKSSPFLQKTPEYVDSVWGSVSSKAEDVYSKTKGKTNEVINDTFLIGVDNWSKDRLKAFLDIRDINYSMFATKKELAQMVRDSRNKPLRDVKEGYFHYLDTFKDWANEKREAVKDSDMYESMNDQVENVNKKAGEFKDRVNEASF